MDFAALSKLNDLRPFQQRRASMINKHKNLVLEDGNFHKKLYDVRQKRRSVIDEEEEEHKTKRKKQKTEDKEQNIFNPILITEEDIVRNVAKTVKGRRAKRAQRFLRKFVKHNNQIVTTEQ